MGTNFKTFQITNQGDELVKFKFTSHSTEDEEMVHRKNLESELGALQSKETKDLLESVADDPNLHEKITILTRSFQNEQLRLQNDELVFVENNLEVSPASGEIYPGRCVEVSAIFQPDKIGSFEKTIFCDIEGRENRLPISIKGNGIGPILSFSHDKIDIGKIFIGSHHTYEVIISNRGQIDGKFTFDQSQTALGRQFEFTPMTGIVPSASHQLIQVCFTSQILGTFNEVFHLKVENSTETLQIAIKGEVIGPTFRFEPSVIDFGTVSLGFEHQKKCKIINTSLVPMDFELGLKGDELESAQFVMSPPKGHLQPESETEIELTFKSTRSNQYVFAMTVDLPGIGKEIISIPVNCRCQVPEIVLETPILELGDIFLDYPIQTKMILRNASTSLRAVYHFSAESDLPQLMVKSSKPSGIIEPEQILELPLEVRAKGLKNLSQKTVIRIDGQFEMFEGEIFGVGRGPEVKASVNKIDWGHIPVLCDETKIVTLTNTALIPAQFSCSFAKANTVWSIEPENSTIPPSSSIEVTVKVNVNDCVHFTDKLTISIANGNQIEIDFSVTGVGTTIVSEPSLYPEPSSGIDFGPIFSTPPSTIEIKPNEEIVIDLEALSQAAGYVKETILCHSIIGQAKAKEKIMQIPIQATFINPLLECSTKEVYFQIDKTPNKELETTEKIVKLNNTSSLPLRMEIRARYPFSIGTEDQ